MASKNLLQIIYSPYGIFLKPSLIQIFRIRSYTELLCLKGLNIPHPFVIDTELFCKGSSNQSSQLFRTCRLIMFSNQMDFWISNQMDFWSQAIAFPKTEMLSGFIPFSNIYRHFDKLAAFLSSFNLALPPLHLDMWFMPRRNPVQVIT